MLGLIPYLVPPEIRLDLPFLDSPHPLGPFGAIVAVGVLLGMQMCLKYAKEKDLDEYLARDEMFWILVFGFIISHWISVLFYFPEKVAEDPWVLAQIWNGLSSVGGFFGAFIGMNWFLWRNKQPVLVFADMNIMGLLIGETLGRFGCTIVHDHPGKVVEPDAFLAMGPWPCRCPPDGKIDMWCGDAAYAHPDCCNEVSQVFRYDLGLLEFLFLVGLTLFMYFVYDWRKSKPGKIVGIVSVAYGLARFTLDFFREDTVTRGVSAPDLRYMGLTTAQFFSLAFVAVGVWLLFVRKPKDSDTQWAKDSDRIAREQAEAGDDDDDEDAAPAASSADQEEE
jgi:phosphatidylglycerol:prolipoprotein diacylglycerol transferase